MPWLVVVVVVCVFLFVPPLVSESLILVSKWFVLWICCCIQSNNMMGAEIWSAEGCCEAVRDVWIVLPFFVALFKTAVCGDD